MTRLFLTSLLAFVCFSGCGRRGLVNSNCEWPHENANPLDLSRPTQQRHLSDDAQFAEDLAIRYADVHKGLHSGRFEGADEYAQAREQCMVTLFDVIGNTHGVSQEQVRTYLAHRRTDLDLAVVLSFAVLYCLASFVVARRVWQRFPPEEGLIPRMVANLITSAFVSVAGLLSGEVWSDVLEGFRVANSHMSYRANRIPWTQHHLGIFIGGVALFWLIAAVQYRFNTADNPKAKSNFVLNLTAN
jgi:hypothetical protein